MRFSSLLCLAATCHAAVVPREDSKSDEIRTWIAGPFPQDNSKMRIATPEIVTMTEEEIMKKGGYATVAEPSDDLVSRNEARDVFGTDDRFLKTDTTYPWIAMGRLLIRTSTSAWICSASMVGPRVLLAARHCIVDGASYTFSPAYNNGDRFPTAFATTIISLPGKNEDNGGCGWKDDWALFILNKNLNQGYLGFKLFQDSMSNNDAVDWYNYGFPGDKSGGNQPYAQNQFKVWKVSGCGSSEGKALESNADAAGGQSGGPVWIPESDGRYQYAVLVGGSSASTIFSHGSALLNAILAARRDFP